MILLLHLRTCWRSGSLFDSKPALLRDVIACCTLSVFSVWMLFILSIFWLSGTIPKRLRNYCRLCVEWLQWCFASSVSEILLGRSVAHLVQS